MAPPLGPVLGELQRAAALLEDLGVGWALVGGLAVGVHADPRFTRDVDLAIAVVNDREAEGLILALRNLGYKVSLALQHEPTGRLSTVRMMRMMRGLDSAGAVMLDLLFASSGIEVEIVRSALTMAGIIETPARVARIGHLIALKTLARDDKRRPQDGVDLRSLIRAADEDELSLALDAVRLITARGFNRNRDLEALLAQAIADAQDLA